MFGGTIEMFRGDLAPKAYDLNNGFFYLHHWCKKKSYQAILEMWIPSVCNAKYITNSDLENFVIFKCIERMHLHRGLATEGK